MSHNAIAWMEQNLKIKNKRGQIVPFTLNTPQRRLIERMETIRKAGLPVRMLVLKTSQAGISTVVQAYFRFLQNEVFDAKSLTIVPSCDMAEGMCETIQRFCTGGQGPKKDYIVRTDMECPFGQYTCQLLDASEIAFWSEPEAWFAAYQMVPNEPNTVIVIETSGNGYDRLCWPMWRRAIVGYSDFIPVFVPWWEVDEYCVNHLSGPLLSGEETELMERFSLDVDQIMWRRNTIINHCAGDVRAFKRQFPSTPEEAFSKYDWSDSPKGCVIAAIENCHDDFTPFCDVTVKVQDSKPVMVEVLRKYKPTV